VGRKRRVWKGFRRWPLPAYKKGKREGGFLASGSSLSKCKKKQKSMWAQKQQIIQHGWRKCW
jgi:hypothetical protein